MLNIQVNNLVFSYTESSSSASLLAFERKNSYFSERPRPFREVGDDQFEIEDTVQSTVLFAGERLLVSLNSLLPKGRLQVLLCFSLRALASRTRTKKVARNRRWGFRNNQSGRGRGQGGWITDRVRKSEDPPSLSRTVRRKGKVDEEIGWGKVSTKSERSRTVFTWWRRAWRRPGSRRCATWCRRRRRGRPWSGRCWTLWPAARPAPASCPWSRTCRSGPWCAASRATSPPWPGRRAASSASIWSGRPCPWRPPTCARQTRFPSILIGPQDLQELAPPAGGCGRDRIRTTGSGCRRWWGSRGRCGRRWRAGSST